ncbi:MAG: SWIM zinc finger family protein [Candidatus Promineifilaceae bacterium]
MVLSEKLIQQIFSANNARRGKQLHETGAVYAVENLSTKQQIHFEALVADGYEEESPTIIIDLDKTSLRSNCSCNEGSMCSHLAALMYTLSNQLTDLNAETLSPEEMQRARLDTTLGNYTVAQLRAIAKRQGWKPRGTRKDAILEQVAERIVSEVKAGTYLEGLAPSQAEMLAALHLAYDINQGVTSAEVMNVNVRLINKRTNWQTTISGLVEYGVLYRDKNAYEDEILYRSIIPFNSFQIPTTVYKLPAHRASRYTLSSPRPETTPLNVSVTQFCQYLGDGRLLLPNPPNWEAPQQNEEAPWINEWPARGEEINALQAETPYFYLLHQHYLTLPINPYVLHPESRQPLTILIGSEAKAEWIVDLLCISSILIESEDGTGYVFNSERFEVWANMPPEEQVQFFYKIWCTLGTDLHEFRQLTRSSPTWELWRMVHPSLHYNLFITDIGYARATIMRFLTQVAKQRMTADADWIKLDTFINKIQQARPDFYHTVITSDAWGFKHNDERVPYTNSRYWAETYGTLIQHIFEGPLFWFGAVELLERKGKATAFRLTSFGRWLLNPTQPLANVHSPNSRAPTKLEWVDNETIKLTPGSNLGNVLNVLNRYTSRVQHMRNHYRLDNERLEKAFSDGESADTVIMAFETIGIPFSADTITHIRRIYQRYGGVHLYENLTVIEFSDDYALAELRASKIITSDHIIHEFSPRLIAVRDSDVDQIAKTLQKKNYTPKIV